MSEHGLTKQEYDELVKTLVKKENNLLLFEKDNKQIYVLGTIHQFHFMEEHSYSLAQMQSVIKTINPDALFIETRPETLEKHNAIDGPFEMILARCYADERGMPVKGIDWWTITKDNEAMNAINLERDDKMVENIIAAAKDYDKVLALVGASHRERAPERFARNGYVQIEVDNILSYFDDVDTSFEYPKGMSEEYIRNRNYFENLIIDEINQSMTPDDELYGMFMKWTHKPPEGRYKMLDMIADNKLFDTNA